MLLVDFCAEAKDTNLLQKIYQQINRLHNQLNLEKLKMQKQNQTKRKLRTRTLIQIGGLVQKSGLMDAFTIESGEDLQDYESIHKAARLLGFLSHCLETNDFTEKFLTEWQNIGERLLRYEKML